VDVSNVDPTAVAIVPYQGTDEVLVVYTKNLGGSNDDGVYSRVITAGGGAGTEVECGDFDSLPDISSPVRISDTDFRVIITPLPGGMVEYRWNDTSWSSVATVDAETDQASPSLFYDRISDDMYLFSVDTATDDVERHYKPSGGSWQAEVIADDGEATTHSYPITQMSEPPVGSARTTPRGLVWAYRVVNGANYDLKVGTLTVATGTLAGHWPFDEGAGQTAGDVSGNGNDGTLGTTAGVDSGDPTWTCVAGGNALDFDGTDDEVRLSNVTIGDSAAWTITAWIKMGADIADQRTIYSEGNTAQTEYLFLYVDDSTDSVRFYSEGPGGVDWTQVIGTTNVEDGTWHLVTMVQRSKIDRELFVGTVSQGTDTRDAGTLTFDTASIGYLRTDWVADPFLGLIDDVRIYDYALSPAEISALAASPPGPCGSTMPDIYYSVGTDTSALYSGNASSSIGTLTLASAAADNIGVGDEVRVGSNRYYITGRNSSTEFTIQNSAANGGTPGDTNITFGSTAITIYRAFNSLFAAEANSSDANHLSTLNLVTGDYQLNWVCYGDGADTTAVIVNGWTTGADNYIKIYTPVSTVEVGTSQRHNGAWDTGAYRLEAASSVLDIQDNYVRVEGLQIRLTSDVADVAGIDINGSLGTCDYEVSHNIVRGNGTGSQDIRLGINLWNAGSGVMKIWNNLIYDWAGGSTYVTGIGPDDPDFTYYIYNNTIVDCNAGIENISGTVIAKNNIAYNNSDNYVGSFDAAGTNNLSGPGSDPQIPPAGAQNGVTLTFANAPGDNFHLAATDAAAIANGADLDGDLNLPITDDIDSDARDASTPDIGADEYGGAPPPQADLSLTQTVDNYTPDIGSSVDFTLTVSNSGPDNATGVEVTDALSTGYTYVSDTPSVGTYNSGSGVWTIGNLANGANATLIITATVNAAGNYTNSAEVTAVNETDPDSTPGDGVGDDFDSVTTTPLVGGGNCPAPSLIFSDGFESGNLGAWDGTVTGSAGDSIAASTLQANTGTYSARAETDAVAGTPRLCLQELCGPNHGFCEDSHLPGTGLLPNRLHRSHVFL
jgi:uncharacterized repeat protein (TIGR01451 family)